MFKTPPALLSRFYQLESSLASHSVTTFQRKNSKKMLQETCLGGIISPGGTATCPEIRFSKHKESCKYYRWNFHQFLKRTWLWLDSNGITLNFKKIFFSKDETEEKHTPNNFKNLRNTFQFSQLCSTIDTKFQST